MSYLERKRRVAGLTQKRLALAAGCSDSHMCNIEAGKCPPGPELLVRIANVIKVDPEELMSHLPERDTRPQRRRPAESDAA